jgi:hypothetical protein
MNKIVNVFRWFTLTFFLITIGVFIVFYLRWFRVAPFVFLNDPTRAFIGGLVLLFLYTIVSFMTRLSELDIAQKTLVYISAIPLLVINVVYLNLYLPRIETMAKCNGITYYITYGAPILDDQWTYIQLTKWRGIFYESHFLGYASDAGANKIKCDADRKEALFIRTYLDPNTLTYIDGENPRSFYSYAGAQLNGNLYFVSEDWSLLENCANQQSQACHVAVYTLYKCNPNYTNCNPLPVSYTNGDVDFLELRASEATNEVSLFEQYRGSDDETLVFTYGANPQCYVDGCAIATK